MSTSNCFVADDHDSEPKLGRSDFCTAPQVTWLAPALAGLGGCSERVSASEFPDMQYREFN